MSDKMIEAVWKRLGERIDRIDARFEKQYNRTEQSMIGQGIAACTLANVPASPAGTLTDGTTLRFISNGRKVGEGVGAGTGVPAYYDPVSTNWLRISDDAIVII